MSQMDYNADVLERRAALAIAAQAVVACGLCDDDGYRGTVVCDHIDRTEIVARGMTKVRTALKGKTS